MATKKIYLIDGSGYIFRAFFATPPLSTSEGFPTNALFGFARMLMKLVRDLNSKDIVMVFDAGKETFRNELYADYKANRSECPEELAPQMPYFRELSEALGFTILQQEGVEADDIIGTVSDFCLSHGVEVVVVSADKDLTQLVNEQVTVYDPMRDRTFTPATVREKFGVEPSQMVEYLAIAGDSSDNIPGLRGAGPKTAAQLVHRYGSVENILARLEEIVDDKSIRNRKKLVETMRSDPEILRLSRTLVAVKRDVCLNVPLHGEVRNLGDLSIEEFEQALERGEPQADALLRLVEKFEFQSLMKEFGKEFGTLSPELSQTSQYKTVLRADFDSFVSRLREQEEFAFDCETDGLDTTEALIIGVAFCWDRKESFYIPLRHTGAQASEQIDPATFLAVLAPIFADANIKKTGQNLKFDIEVLLHAGMEVRGVAFDTLIASYLLNPDRSRSDLGTLSQEFLGVRVSEFSDVVPKGGTFGDVALDQATQYAAEDAHAAFLLVQELRPRIESEELTEVFHELEMPLVSVLANMELRGVQLDLKLLQAMSDEFEDTLTALRAQIFEASGCEFNINSPKQLSEVLFEKLQISTKGLRRTKTGISTNHAVLEKIRHLHPVPDLLLEYRSIHKLKSTYVDALPAQISPATGRLHTSLNQAVTGTGRLSSSNPNLQNIPVQSAEGRRIRQAFIAPEGKLLLSADYSQIELRLLAHLSGDENLCAAFQGGCDIHAATARELLGLKDDADLTQEQRRIGKTINFGIIYGMGPFRLARDLGISYENANRYIEEYFARYPKVQQYFQSLEQQGEREGFVSTISGRKRYLSQIDFSGRDSGFLRRVALNAPLQGSAADIIKKAMVELEDSLRAAPFQCEMILQIHDELLFEVEHDAASTAEDHVRRAMENVWRLRVPLRVDVGTGKNWREAH